MLQRYMVAAQTPVDYPKVRRLLEDHNAVFEDENDTMYFYVVQLEPTAARKVGEEHGIVGNISFVPDPPPAPPAPTLEDVNSSAAEEEAFSLADAHKAAAQKRKPRKQKTRKDSGEQ